MSEAIDYLKTPYTVTIDPVGVFGNVERERLLDACGVIPGWITEAAINNRPLIKALDVYKEAYGLFECKGVTIGGNGEFRYPGDSELFPFIKIETDEEIFYQYRNARIAIVHKPTGHTFASIAD